jgi:hypothetical protein
MSFVQLVKEISCMLSAERLRDRRWRLSSDARGVEKLFSHVRQVRTL